MSAAPGGVVTVSRQYGAGGLSFAPALAEALGYRLADRELVELAAREAGVEPEAAARLDERVPAAIERVGLALAAASPEFGLGIPPPVEERALAVGVRAVVTALAAEGSVVILGRGGQAILGDRPRTVHLQLVAPLEHRAAAIAASHGGSIDDARERCRRVDDERADHVRRFHGVDINDPLLYDAVFNTARLGIPGAVAAAVSLVRERLGGG